MTRAFVALGSNLDPEANTLAAVRLLARRARLVAASTFYRTESIPRGAPRFVNGVVAIESALSARALKFELLRAIESKLGRVRTADRDAPRTIDCDLLLYDDAVSREPDLVLPHPDVTSRAFVAVPLLAIAGDRVLPGTARTLSDIVASLPRGAMQPLDALTRAVREEVDHGCREDREPRS